MRRLLLGLAAMPTVVLPGMSARAAIYHVAARTEAQAFQMPSYAGRAAGDPSILSSYRIVQYLDLGAFDLGASGDRGARVDFVTSLRLENDFGFDEEERSLLDHAGQPELHLLYGYLEWTGAAGGLFDLRLGRQIRFDWLQFYALDGLDVTVHTPAHLAVSLFGGWQVKGTSVLGSSTFAPDGVRVSDRRRIAAGATTDLLADPAAGVAWDFLDAPSPMFGARLELEGIRNVEALATWRRAVSHTSGANVEALPEAAKGWQVDLEHLGFGGRVRLFGRWWVSASADRDLFRDRWAALRAGTAVEVIDRRLRVQAEVASYQPSFDADSIWNLFATGARDEAEVRVDWRVGETVDVWAGPVLTIFRQNLRPHFAVDNDVDPDGTSWLPGGIAGISSRPGRPWRMGVDTFFLVGGDDLGDELWLSGRVGRSFYDSYDLEVRLSYAQVSDPWGSTAGDLQSMGVAALGRAQLTETTSVLLIVEENFNRFKASDLRGYAVLDVRAIFR